MNKMHLLGALAALCLPATAWANDACDSPDLVPACTKFHDMYWDVCKKSDFDGNDPQSMMGPLVTAEHRDRVTSYVQGAADEGARVVVDGSSGACDQGFFTGCSLIDDVKPGMRLYDDEIFGPVLGVVRVPSFDEAVTLINANPYGNGVALFTRDGGTARRFEREVTVGMVGINVPIPVPVAFHSFGGWKASLFGDSPIYGPEGIRFYTRPKVVTSRWPEPTESAIDLGFPSTR